MENHLKNTPYPVWKSALWSAAILGYGLIAGILSLLAEFFRSDVILLFHGERWLIILSLLAGLAMLIALQSRHKHGGIGSVFMAIGMVTAILFFGTCVLAP